MEWNRAWANSRNIKGQITQRQVQQLFNLCELYNQEGSLMLDIGTFQGYSTSIMAQAAPFARIITCNPVAEEIYIARKNLKQYKNVEVIQERSWDLFEQWDRGLLDFIFVDGDHNHVNRDLEWYDKLVPGGLIIFHDYNPPGRGSDSPVLRSMLDKFIQSKGRKFDYMLMDEEIGRGMVGINRRA